MPYHTTKKNKPKKPKTMKPKKPKTMKPKKPKGKGKK
jgi:hypothetical protein